MSGGLSRFVLVSLATACLSVGLGGCGKGESTSGSGSKERVIAVIPKGTTHAFWKSVRAGAEKAAEETGVKVIWNGPDLETDREKQIQIIEDFLVRKVDGFVLAPLDAGALVPSVENIASRGIPCAIIDSDISTDKYTCFAATDNYQGGVIAAKRMGEILGGKGRVVVIRYNAGSGSTTNRETGFIDTIASDFPEIQIVGAEYGGATVEGALQVTEDLLTRNPELDGLFACNESTSVGALQGLISQKRIDGVRMIGFDSAKALVDALEAGQIDSLIVQNPYRMGYLGVLNVLAALDGKAVEKKIDTGVELVRKEDLGRSEIKSLIGLP